MSGLTSFAIFGLGRLGSCILESLLEFPESKYLTIHILTRPGSRKDADGYPSNVSFYSIDYSEPSKAEEQLIAALEEIQVVISTVGAGVPDPELLAQELSREGKHSSYIPGYASQHFVARAARKAGCKLLLPAEYGSPTHWLDPEGRVFTRGKRIFQLELVQMDLPFVLFYTGKFIEPDPPRSPLPENTLEMDESPFPTSRHHAAQFIVHTLLNVPTERLAWGIYMIRGSRREMMVNGKWKQFEIPSIDETLSMWLTRASLSESGSL